MRPRASCSIVLVSSVLVSNAVAVAQPAPFRGPTAAPLRSPAPVAPVAPGVSLVPVPAPAIIPLPPVPPPDTGGPREDELLARWLANSPEVLSWRSQIGAARFDVVTATLFPNPQLQLNTMITLAGTPPDGRFNYGAQITFPLPIFGQVGARERAAIGALRVVEVNVVNQVWARATDIQAAMVTRAFAGARVEGGQRNLAEISRIEQIVRLRVAAGANADYDVLRVEVARATLQAALVTATVERDRSESDLVALVADPALTGAGITRTGLVPFRGPDDEAQLTEQALTRRPDLELARRGIVAAQASARRFEREVIPVPSVFVGGYITHQEPSASLQGGVSFTLPTFDRNQGLVGHALADAQTQRNLAAALETRIRNEVHGSFRARQLARQSLETFRANGLTANAELLRRAEVSYQAGRFTIVELLDAYRTMWDARQQELDLERALADAEAALQRAAAMVLQP